MELMPTIDNYINYPTLLSQTLSLKNVLKALYVLAMLLFSKDRQSNEPHLAQSLRTWCVKYK